MAKLKINGKLVDIDVDGSTPLLWVLREQLGLTGTKYSCGIGLCGSCTVHLDGEAVRSCVTRFPHSIQQRKSPLSKACQRTVTTLCSRPGRNSTYPSADTVSRA